MDHKKTKPYTRVSKRKTTVKQSTATTMDCDASGQYENLGADKSISEPPQTIVSEKKKSKSVIQKTSMDGREDNPEAILGLEEVSEVLQASELPHPVQQDQSNEESVDDSDIDDDLSEDEFMSLDEDDCSEDEANGDDMDSSPCFKQAVQLAEKLVSNTDNVSFNELTSMLDDGDPETDPGGEDDGQLDIERTEVDGPVDHSTDASKTKQQQPQQQQPMQSIDHFEKEFSEQQRLQLRRGRGGGRRGRGSRLHPTLSALMGQANLCYSHGRTEEAIKMCLEIIRQFPNSPLPYDTLALIFEGRGQMNKRLQFQLMAAFLSPHPEKWIDLADFYKDEDELEQAVYCYSRAIKLCPTNLVYHWHRVELLERLGSMGRALKCYAYMLKFLKPDQAEAAMKLAKEIAKIHLSECNYNAARHALETAFLRHPSHVTHQYTDLLLEVLTAVADHLATIRALVDYAGVKLVAKESQDSEFPNLPMADQLTRAVACVVPQDLPLQLSSKLTVSLIRSGAFDIAQPHVQRLMSESSANHGDLFIATVEAYLSMQRPLDALCVLHKLLCCPVHRTTPTVWRLYAEALLDSDGSTEKAVEAYYKVVELSPDNAAVRLSLAQLLLDQQQNAAALAVLTEARQPYHSQVLLRKCEVLYDTGLLEQFVSTVALLLSRHFTYIRSRDEAEVLINNKKASNKLEALRDLRRSKGDANSHCEATHTGPELPLGQQWKMFVRACQILHQKKRYSDLERLSYSALGARELMKEHLREIEFICLQASMANGNSYFAFNLMRDIVVRMSHNDRVWNLLNQVIIRADDFRHNRFLLRLSQKYPDSLALSMLNGHNCLVAGTYKYSLAEYMKVFKGNQTDYLASLMLGLTYVHMACQKFSADKNTLVTQAWVFLNSYRELRGDCQESLYNIGRAMHQLNILHQAIHYYDLALQCPVPVSSDGTPDMDLTSTIAFNMSLLYRKSSDRLSRYYIRKYITI